MAEEDGGEQEEGSVGGDWEEWLEGSRWCEGKSGLFGQQGGNSRARNTNGRPHVCKRYPLFCEQHTRLEQEQRVAKALLSAQHASELYKAVQDES